MSLLRVEAALLRTVLPDLVLREGMRIVATVAERAGQKGIIVLAGTPLAAQLPDDVQVGDVLRLVVAETSSERVVLRIADPAATAAPVPPPTVGVPLPGGMTARVAVDERDGGRAGGDASREHHELRVTYASASLGRLELHLALAGDEALRVHVRARAGAPFELAERHATELADAIGAATGKPAQVTVSPRHDPLDVYA
ncbi:MAG: hypothetical protein QOD69_1490 [Solirubrobacteraceae bacterium]|jgi:hypothetical protein|nr:hypothetical protein [Solirubrobacteraceae bacterium]